MADRTLVPDQISCLECADGDPENMVCLDSWNDLKGWCCKKGDTSNYCKLGRSNQMCSGLTEKGGYAFCPFEIDKCYPKPVLSMSTTE